MENLLNKSIETDIFIKKMILTDIEDTHKAIDVIDKMIETSQYFTKIRLQFLKLKLKYSLKKTINLS